jgi:hypothetical protein
VVSACAGTECASPVIEKVRPVCRRQSSPAELLFQPVHLVAKHGTNQRPSGERSGLDLSERSAESAASSVRRATLDEAA